MYMYVRNTYLWAIWSLIKRYMVEGHPTWIIYSPFPWVLSLHTSFIDIMNLSPWSRVVHYDVHQKSDSVQIHTVISVSTHSCSLTWNGWFYCQLTAMDGKWTENRAIRSMSLRLESLSNFIHISSCIIYPSQICHSIFLMPSILTSSQVLFRIINPSGIIQSLLHFHPFILSEVFGLYFEQLY